MDTETLTSKTININGYITIIYGPKVAQPNILLLDGPTNVEDKGPK